ncbi:unnamed protein product [Prunus brigantina]
MPENNDGAKVCVEEHGNNCNDGTNYPFPGTNFPSSSTNLSSFLVHLRSSVEVIDKGFIACQDLPWHPLTRRVPLGLSNSVWRHDSHSPHVLGTSDAGADDALLLLAVSPHTPLLGTSNIAAGTALHLPAVLPPNHYLLRTCDIAIGTALHLPACCLLLFRRLFSLAWGQLARCTASIFLDTIGCTNLQHV